MKRQAEILVLARAGLATHITERLRALGHGLFALVHSADEARQAVTQSGDPVRGRPDLVLVDLALVDLAQPDLISRDLASVPAVYVTEREEVLVQVARLRRDDDGEEDPGDEPITSSLAPRELSLAIQLALWRAQALSVEEARYRAIVEDQTELICRFLPSGPITFVNEAYCRYFDKTAEELVGHSFMPLIPEEDHEVLDRSFASLGLDNPVVSHEHRVLLPSGEIRWQSWTNRVILDGAGEVIEYQAVGRDVTERKQAEDALRRSEARYLSIFQRAAVPIWEEDISELLQALRALQAGGVTDLATYLGEQPEQAFGLISRSKLVDMNDEFLKLFGAESRAEMLRSHADIFLPESLPLLRAMLVALAEGEGHHACEIPLCTLQGERLNLLMRVSFPTAGQGFENMLLSCVDITDRKRAEEQVRQLNADLRRRAAELQAANTELESFSYSVSHDLRAPLRAIDGFSVAVIEDYADQIGERGRGYLRRVRQASQRMSRLIDDLLDLSRMTRSAMHLEACDMSAMAQAVIHALRKGQPERDVEVAIEPGMRVLADPGLLRVVLENLLGNAWKFTGKQPRAHIHVGTTEHDGRVAYFVRDDGAGFDMAHVGKLFGAFQRLHGMHDFEGTGIGLATVRRIIRRHGGDIWAEGKEGEGATFTFTLA